MILMTIRSIMDAKSCRLLVLCSIIFYSITITEVEGGLFCQNNWNLYSRDQKCVQYFKDSRPWQQARNMCIQKGGDLVRIDNQAKFNFIKGLQNKFKLSAWLGLSRITIKDKTGKSKSVFRWLDDKTEIAYTAWRKGEPNNNREKCGHVTNSVGQWNDGDCNAKRSYVCENPAFHTAPIECPPGWSLFNRWCFRHFKDSLSWYDARDFCRTQQARLATIPGQGVQNFIGKTFKLDKWAWIGLNDINQHNKWEWADTTQSANFKKWSPNEPNGQIRSTENCVQMYASSQHLWDDTTCYQKKQFICHKDVINADLLCKEGWDLNFKYKTCLKYFRNAKSWNDARKDCKNKGGDLVKIPDRGYNDYIKGRLLAISVNYWIGIHQVNKVPVWLDEGKPATFTSYGRTLTLTDGCGFYGSNTKNWTERKCTDRFSYICQSKPYASVSCPDGYESNSKLQACIKLSTDAQPWEKAREFCQSEGSDLVTIKDSSMADFINEMVALNKATYWIGLHDRQKDNIFQWLDSTDLAIFSQWADGQPDDIDGTKNCAQIDGTKDGKWIDSNCMLSDRYICQHPPTINGKNPSNSSLSRICKVGWSKYDKTNTCIQFQDDERTWQDARNICKKEGGDLVKIEDEEFGKFVTSTLKSQLPTSTSDLEPFIGINNIKSSSDYVWLDEKEHATYTNWINGISAEGNSRCGVMVVKETETNFQWVNIKCTDKRRYICQEPALPPEGLNCGVGWEDSTESNVCYRFNPEPLTWIEAESSCKVNGGDLLSLPTSDEMFYIIGLLEGQQPDQMYWTGGNILNPNEGWRWSDSKPFAFINWAAGEPNRNVSADCLALDGNTGLWRTFESVSHLPSICKKQAYVNYIPSSSRPTPSVVIPDGMEFGCPQTWEGYMDKCYQVFRSEEGIDWKSANVMCQREGGSLATINNEDENKVVITLLPHDFGYAWIGLNDFRKRYSFAWSSDVSVDYTIWEVDQPDIADLDNACVQMSDKTGKWHTEPCLDNSNYFVCSQEKGLHKKQDKSLTHKCDKDQKGYLNKCYAHFNEKSTFADAEQECKKQKGTLATVGDSYVQAFLSTHTSTEVWIGLSNTKKATTGDEQGNYVYSWTSGADISFTHWDRSHSGEEENTCVSFLMEPIKGLWHSSDCNEKKYFICEYDRPGYTTPKPVITTPKIIPCPTDWIGIGKMCYKIIISKNTQYTWMAAKASCQGMASYATLVSITDLALSRKLIKEVKKITMRTLQFWIGLNDRDTEGGYSWVGGEPLLYKTWARGEPNNNGHREDCVEMKLTSYATWNDNNCYAPLKNFICQAPRGTIAKTTVTPPIGDTDPRCGDGNWKVFRGHCYIYMKGYSWKNWFDAQSQCNKKGAHLVSIEDDEENGFVTSLFERKAGSRWIGLNDLNDDVYKWVDGTPLTYNAWKKGEPNDAGGGERCVVISSDGQWNDMACSSRLRYVCEKQLGTTGAITSKPFDPPTGGCPSKFFGVPGTTMCYYVGGKEKSDRLTFSKASDQCKKINDNSRLASIHSFLDEEFIITMISDLVVPPWIGFKTSSSYGKGRFKWVDNTPTGKVFWARNQPRSGNLMNCVDMMVKGKMAGRWKNLKCDKIRLPYICGHRKDELFRYNEPNTEGCPKGYTRYRDSCYKFLSDQQTWLNSLDSCYKDKGGLVTINDRFDAGYINVLLDQEKVPAAWIGLSMVSGETTFSWYSGWPVLFTNWGQKKIDLTKKCVTLTDEGTWSTNDCSLNLPAICEIQLGRGPALKSSVPGKCPNNKWVHHGDYCYHLEAKQRKSWPDANLICTETLGSALMSIHSSAEMDFMKLLIAQDLADVWIGFHSSSSANFEWSDDTEEEYYNWADGAPTPTNETSNQDCVMVQAYDGKWLDLNCFTKHGYVCKMPHIPIPTTSTTTSSTSSTAKTVNTKLTGFSTQGPGFSTQGHGVNNQGSGSATGEPKAKSSVATGQPTADPGDDGITQKLQSHPKNDPDISDGGIAGIVIGVIAFIAIIVVINVIIRKKGRAQNSEDTSGGFDNALYSASKRSSSDGNFDIKFHKNSDA